MMTRIVGVDLAMRATGIARLTLDSSGAPATYTTAVGRQGELRATLAQRWQRMRETTAAIVDEVLAATRAQDPHLVVIEGPAPSTGAQIGSFDTAHLWWSVVDRCLDEGIPVTVVAPSTLKAYATGNGRAKKPEIVAAVRKHYGDRFDVTSHDVADAVVLVAMGARALARPIDQLPEQHTRAMRTPKWPSTTEPSEETARP